ncbi:MAG: helix-turn-helix domain-containing protein [Verrucomicrobiales bacterium]
MNVQSPQELGVLVREERKKRGWTQALLAEHVGVQPLWISEFERGKTTAQIGLVFRTLKALGLTISVGEPNRSGGKGTVIDLDSLVQTGATDHSLELFEKHGQSLKENEESENE